MLCSRVDADNGSLEFSIVFDDDTTQKQETKTVYVWTNNDNSSKKIFVEFVMQTVDKNNILNKVNSKQQIDLDAGLYD